jgi:hypothetical protein
MTLGEEKALPVRFAKAAGAGEMLNIHDLKAAYEKAIGQPGIIPPMRERWRPSYKLWAMKPISMSPPPVVTALAKTTASEPL